MIMSLVLERKKFAKSLRQNKKPYKNQNNNNNKNEQYVFKVNSNSTIVMSSGIIWYLYC